ncbi:MAG: hypothetical protein N2Z74_09765, partial [Syntrophales bacterium]|nr:hypothetical protein [Syntrophales bacterium]
MYRTLYFLYNLLFLTAVTLAAPYYLMVMLVKGRYRRSLGPKLGITDPEVYKAMKGHPRLWFHAVSVGEVTAAAPVVAALREMMPAACIVLSTSTETGQETARRLVRDATAIFYYPLDIPWVVEHVLDRVNPALFILVETELWPNFLRACRRRGVKVLMVNGRISPRSFKGYRRTRFFWKEVLSCMDGAAMISSVDAQRIAALGMAPAHIGVFGNAKFDALAARVAPSLQGEAASLLGLTERDKVLMAGSTHAGEETVVLEAYRRLHQTYPDLLLILAPRHVERANEVVSLVKAAGYDDVLT